MKNQNLKSKLMKSCEQNLAELQNNLDVLNPETLESVTGGTSLIKEKECDKFKCGAYQNCGIV